MYKTVERIGPGRVNKNRKLKFSSMVDMMQDASQLWIECEPVFESYLKDNGLGLLISSRQVDVIKYPLYKEKITICTGVFNFTNCLGYRNTAMYDDMGEICAVSWSNGVLVDMQTERMVRLPQHVIDSMTFDDKLEMDYLPKRIITPDGAVDEFSHLQIRRSDIDMYDHVNNAKYIEIAMEVLPLDFEVKRMRVEYKIPAKLGCKLHPKRIRASEDTYYVSLGDENNRAYAVLEFSKR